MCASAQDRGLRSGHWWLEHQGADKYNMPQSGDVMKGEKKKRGLKGVLPETAQHPFRKVKRNREALEAKKNGFRATRKTKRKRKEKRRKMKKKRRKMKKGKK